MQVISTVGLTGSYVLAPYTVKYLARVFRAGTCAE